MDNTNEWRLEKNHGQTSCGLQRADRSKRHVSDSIEEDTSSVQKGPDVYSSPARILYIQRTETEALIRQSERLFAAHKARINAVLERLRHTVQQDSCPPPQPPACSGQRPVSSGRRRRPAGHDIPCNAEVVVTVDTYRPDELRDISPIRNPRELLPAAPPDSQVDGYTLQTAKTLQMSEDLVRGVQKRRENFNHDCNTAGEDVSPYPELEEAWRRRVRDKKMRQKAKEERERLAEEERRNLLPGGGYTEAEFRYNTYIHPEDLLPLPKPYGGQPPFRPYKPPASMRHVRKPAFKPIVI